MDLIKKQLFCNLKSLNKQEQIHIFNFLKINNHSITINNNGVYFTLDHFSEKLLFKLNNLILNIIKNRENSSTFEESRQNEIDNYKQTLVDKTTLIKEKNHPTLFKKILDHDSNLILEIKKIKYYSSSRYNSSTIDIASRRKKKIKHLVFDRIFKRIRSKGSSNKSEETGNSKCENYDMFDNNNDNNDNDNDNYTDHDDNDNDNDHDDNDNDNDDNVLIHEELLETKVEDVDLSDVESEETDNDIDIDNRVDNEETDNDNDNGIDNDDSKIECVIENSDELEELEDSYSVLSDNTTETKKVEDFNFEELYYKFKKLCQEKENLNYGDTIIKLVIEPYI